MNIRALQEELEKERAILKSAKDRIALQNEELDRLRKESQQNKKNEEALEDANIRFAQLIGNLQIGVFAVDENGIIIVINETFCRQFGITVTPDTLIGTSSAKVMEHIRQLFRDPKDFSAGVDAILREKKPVINDELKLVNGHIFNRDYIPIFSKGGYKGHVWKFTDITRNKTIGDTFEAQRKFYEQILNNIPADIIVLSTDHRFLYVNPRAISKPDLRKWIIGKSNAEYSAYTNKPAEISENRERIFSEVIATKTRKEFEERLVTPNGEVEYQLRIMYPVLDAAGEVEIVIGYGLDITARKKIEEQILLSEKRYRDIFNFSRAWIGSHDISGRILTMNPAACEILGYSADEMVGKQLESFIPEKYRHEFSANYLKTIQAQGKAEGIMSILNSNGKTLNLLYHNYLVTETDSEPYVIGFAQDITQRLHAEEALKRSEEKYKGIIQNMNLGMIEIDNDERITFANQRFCTMSGYSLGELTGSKATDLLLKGVSLKKTKNELSRKQFEINNSYELAVKTKSGEDRWWLTSATPVLNPDGSVKGTISIHLDITEKKKLEEQLRLAKQETERSSQYKDMFLTNMSHEIRTPLNAIMGLGKLLSKSELNPQQKNYLQGIENASANLLSIINDLLDFSKIEAGKITLENISFSLRDICQQAVNVLEHKAEEKGLKLLLEIDERIAPLLIGDPFRVNQVFMNMLSNAIKFTEKGSVRLGASLLSEENESQKILVTVEDTGVGIKEEYLKTIFDKFTQEDETVVRKFGGTGLGMSITKQLTELMGGSIKIDSKKNIGTTVSLTFEFKIGTARVFEKKRTIKNETANINGKKILIVEDNGLNRLLASTILSDYGAEITEAENGQQAVDAMRATDFDVVLMDIQMPVMDGIQATKIIRDEISKTVPILALTANAIKGQEHYFKEAGMNDYIFKPYTEVNLVNPIARWISRSEEHPAVQAKTPATPQPTSAKPAPEQKASSEIVSDGLYDLTKLKTLARNDIGFITKMVKLFTEETPQAVQKIVEGYNTGDYASVRYYAHRMKPSITNLAINSLTNDILKLEFMIDGDPAMRPLVEKVERVIGEVISQLKKEYDVS